MKKYFKYLDYIQDFLQEKQDNNELNIEEAHFLIALNSYILILKTKKNERVNKKR